jgi:hypothetical protein
VLAPKDTPDGAVFTVEGNLELFSGLPDVMLLVAPQGFTCIETKWFMPDFHSVPHGVPHTQNEDTNFDLWSALAHA